MSRHIINIKELIGTSNAIIQKLGQKVFEEAFSYLSNGHTVVLDFDGISNLTSGFCNASIGNLYQAFPNIADANIVIVNINLESIWYEKIQDAINLARNPEKAKKIDDAILELFE